MPMTKDDIEGFRIGFKSLMDAMVEMARNNGEPIGEIMQVMRDAPASIDQLCNLALRGIAVPEELLPKCCYGWPMKPTCIETCPHATEEAKKLLMHRLSFPATPSP